MVRRPLGRTGLKVSPIGLGTVKLGRNTGVKYPEEYELPTDAEVERLLARALELGVNLIDTAPAYGEAEARLGPWVAAHRGEIVLVTKCGERHEGGKSSWDFSAKGLAASVEGSLKRLRTDRVDVLLLHSDGRDLERLAEAAGTLRKMKTSGKAIAVGISVKSGDGAMRGAELLDVVMGPYSLDEPFLEVGLEGAHLAGAGVLGIKAVSQGRAADPGYAVEYAVSQPFIDCVVIGTRDPVHLEEAVRSAEKAL